MTTLIKSKIIIRPIVVKTTTTTSSISLFYFVCLLIVTSPLIVTSFFHSPVLSSHLRPPPNHHHHQHPFKKESHHTTTTIINPHHHLITRSLTPSSTSLLHSTTPSNNSYDLIIIGGGPAGVQASLLSTSLSHRTLLIDAPLASGVLLDPTTTSSSSSARSNDLSIGAPTGLFSKALRDTSKRINVKTLRGMGLREDSVWNEIVNSCVDLASANAEDVRRQLESAGVDVLEGYAQFSNPQESKSEEEEEGGAHIDVIDSDGVVIATLHAPKILIASGSRPHRPSDIPFAAHPRRIFDSDSINNISYLPSSIAITGSGIIAIEYAKIFSNLGAAVTLIIRDDVPRKALMKIGLDKDVAACLVADLIRSGIGFERGAQVKEFEVSDDGEGEGATRVPLKLTLEGRNGELLPNKSPTKEIKCDAYLAAVGRVSNADRLNLDAVGIGVDAYGGIVVDGTLMTSRKGVYAAGDVLGRPFLASIGVAQAIAAVNNMFDDDVDIATDEEEEEEAMIPSSSSSSTGPIIAADELCTDWDLTDDDNRLGGYSFDPASLACNPFAFPVGIWSTPEAAWYGVTTSQAQERGIDAGEGMALYAECTRGQIFSPNGLLKLVFVKETGRIIGVHICGDDACELVHYGMELIRSKRTVGELAGGLYSAITYHEMYRIAAKAGLDEAGARKRRAAVGKALAKRWRGKTYVT